MIMTLEKELSFNHRQYNLRFQASEVAGGVGVISSLPGLCKLSTESPAQPPRGVPRIPQDNPAVRETF